MRIEPLYRISHSIRNNLGLLLGMRIEPLYRISHSIRNNLGLLLGFLTMFEMNRTLKDKGDEGELLVAEHYQNNGHTLLVHKYTIHGGELDLIFEKDKLLTFVEVKVVDNVDDLFDYITPKKLGTVKRTMERYLLKYPTDKEYVLDIVFVKNNSIVEIYENVTGT